MRCSSSWMTSSGGREPVPTPNKAPVRSSHATRANLSMVPISSDGGRRYRASSTTLQGSGGSFAPNSHS